MVDNLILNDSCFSQLLALFLVLTNETQTCPTIACGKGTNNLAKRKILSQSNNGHGV